MKKKIFPLFLVLLFFALSITASARQVIVDPSQDSTIATYDHDNYGDWETLCIGHLYGKMWYPLIQFDLTYYHNHDVIVESAYLRIYVHDARGYFPPTDIWIGRITDSWGEMVVTWDNFPGADDSTAISGPDSIGDWWVIDVTRYVSDWVNGSYANYGFILGTLDYNDDFFEVCSREFSGSYDRPKLELNYHDVCVNPGSLGNIKAIFM